MADSLCLYIDLENGQTASLDVVARAALALSAAVRETAFLIDPSLSIRIELESGTEGSLRLNTIFRVIQHVAPTKNTMAAIIGVVLTWFANDLQQYGVDVLLDKYFKENKAITADERKQIIESVNQAVRKQVAKESVQQIYRELDRDSAIRGIGATSQKNMRPETIVPKTQFVTRSGRDIIVEAIDESRSVTTTQTLILISPVLVHSARGWRFFSNGVEFTAKIVDNDFLESALTGTARIPFKEGVNLLVEMKSDERKEDGVWVVKKRSILKVLKITTPAQQQSLNLPSSNED